MVSDTVSFGGEDGCALAHVRGFSDFADWGDPERLAANVVAAYREDAGEPDDTY
jgi:hypothetical protein